MSQIYSAASNTKLKSLYMLQKKAVKHIFNLSRDHPTNEVFRENILPLPGLIKYEQNLTTYKLTKGLLCNAQSLVSFIPQSTAPLTRNRTQPNLSTHFPRTEIIKRSYFYKGMLEYNSIAEETRNGTFSCFKNAMKQRFIGNITFTG